MKWYCYTAVLLCLAGYLVYAAYLSCGLIWDNVQAYLYVAIGACLYGVMHRYVKRNMSFAQTFTHELTHTVIDMFFQRRILAFNAREREGNIMSSGRRQPQLVSTLAPYCLPIYTYGLMVIWSFVATRQLVSDHGLWFVDLLIGFTACFHAICFYTQTGTHQPDIRSYPLFFSYTYIYTFRLFNVLLLLLCYCLDKEDTPLRLHGALWHLITVLFQ